MAHYGGFNFTTFSGVNLKNTAAIRIQADGGKVGTLAVRSSVDADRQWFFPDKSGTFGITGTFTVNLPAITKLETYGTNVTVSGVRAEDAMVCTIQNGFTTTTANDHANNGVASLIGCQCGDGGVNLTFNNPTDTATIYEDLVLAYTIVR